MKKAYFKVFIITALAVTVAISAAGATFSWYDRTASADITAKQLNYSQNGKVTGAGVKRISTHIGTNSDGNIDYTEISETDNITFSADKPLYFKTVIEDESGFGDTPLSLYVGNLTFSSACGNTYEIVITSPTKACENIVGNAVSGGFETGKICISRDLNVKKHGSTEVYWFINCEEATALATGTLNLENLYVAYN